MRIGLMAIRSHKAVKIACLPVLHGGISPPTTIKSQSGHAVIGVDRFQVASTLKTRISVGVDGIKNSLNKLAIKRDVV